jgi:cysteine desulfurase
MRRIYLDHNATTPVDPAVLDAMLPYFSAEYGNASSVHSFGQRARAAVAHARQAVAALIGARPTEIVFTSGGTESDNAAILGILGGAPSTSPATAHIITTAIEHDAVLHTCRALERRGSASVTCVPVASDGRVDPDDVRRALRPETILISVMHANNELGTLQPLQEISRVAAEAGVRFHTDAVQSVGKAPVDVNILGVDMLSLSAHKFYGPKGVGALFVRKGLTLEPLLHGGHNERERRAGTENVAGIVGLGEAAELAQQRLAEDATRLSALRDRLEQGLLTRVPQARVNGGSAGVTAGVGAASRVPNTSNMIFPGIDAEALVIALDLQGIACSAGAACSSGAADPSHVLAAIGLSQTEARASVRLSLGRNNTDDDISQALEIIPAAVQRQRELSRASREQVWAAR